MVISIRPFNGGLWLGLNGERSPARTKCAQPVNLTVRYIHSSNPGISSSSAAALFMALMISRFRKSACRFSSSGKAPLPTGDPVENTGNFTCDPRQPESTECGFHHFSGSLAFFSSCASACARVSRWRSYSIVHGWRSVSLACRSSSTLGAAFRSQFQHPFSAYHFMTSASHKAPHYPSHHLLTRTGIPCSCQF